MSALVMAPAMLPLATAALTAAARGRPALQQAVAWLGMLALLGCALALLARVAAGETLTLAFGGWALPMAI